MSGGPQIVSWALERPCALRTGEQWTCPARTLRSLAMLQHCDEAITSGKAFEGVWITSFYEEYVPVQGISIDQVAEPYGGWGTIKSSCFGCEANVSRLPEVKLTGCYGVLCARYPFNRSFDQALWDVVKRSGWGNRLRESFPVTTPLWFGFWIQTPLTKLQCEFLRDLLPLVQQRLKEIDDIVLLNDKRGIRIELLDESVRSFVSALEASLHYSLPLHVQLSPARHTDFGFLTTFAHCPRCKAEADVERWKEVKSQQLRCQVCQQEYDPSTTRSVERDTYSPEKNSLEKQFGDSFNDFAFRYANYKGWPLEEVEQALRNFREQKKC